MVSNPEQRVNHAPRLNETHPTEAVANRAANRMYHEVSGATGSAVRSFEHGWAELGGIRNPQLLTDSFNTAKPFHMPNGEIGGFEFGPAYSDKAKAKADQMFQA